MSTLHFAERYIRSQHAAAERIAQLGPADRMTDALESKDYLAAIGVGLRAVLIAAPVAINGLLLRRNYERSAETSTQPLLGEEPGALYQLAQQITHQENL